MNVFQNHKAMMVRNLRPGLTEVGKIKIGEKGHVTTSRKGTDFQPPKKLDHFKITTLNRGADGNYLLDHDMHERFGPQPTELPVRLLFNDPWLNFQTVYVAYRGASRWCVGDGERAQRMDEGNVACPCHRLDMDYDGADKCKINGTLSVVIDGAPVVGGVWKLRTTSMNTCQGIASSLMLLQSMTRGQLAGVPFVLTVRPKATTTPGGKLTVVYVVGLEYRGGMEQLRQLAYDRASADAAFGARMQAVEEQARLMLAPPAPSAVVDGDDVETVEEFYPEAAKQAHGIKPPNPPAWSHEATSLPTRETVDPETGEVTTPRDWSAEIGNATTREALDAIARDIAAAKAGTPALREAVKKRRLELAPPPPDDVPPQWDATGAPFPAQTLAELVRKAADRKAVAALLADASAAATLRTLDQPGRLAMEAALREHYGDDAAGVLDDHLDRAA